MHKNVCPSVHTCACTLVHTYLCTFVHISAHMWTSVHKSACTSVHKCAYLCVHKCAQVLKYAQECMHKCAHLCMHSCAYLLVHTVHICLHMCRSVHNSACTSMHKCAHPHVLRGHHIPPVRKYVCAYPCVSRGSYVVFCVSQVCAPLGMLRETQIFQYMYVYAPPRVAAEIKFFHFPSTYVQMCPSSCAPREPNSSISQVCNPSHLPPRRPNCSISQVCAFLVCQNSHLLKYVPILVCPARFTFLNFASMCPSSCAPREQQISIARACAHPRVPRGYQTSPLLKYVSLTMCPAEIQILHLSSMPLSSCAPR